jgi:hypothetical protein
MWCLTDWRKKRTGHVNTKRPRHPCLQRRTENVGRLDQPVTERIPNIWPVTAETHEPSARHRRSSGNVSSAMLATNTTALMLGFCFLPQKPPLPFFGPQCSVSSPVAVQLSRGFAAERHPESRRSRSSKHAFERLQLRMSEVDALGLTCMSVRHSKGFRPGPGLEGVARFPGRMRSEQRAFVTARSPQKIEIDEARYAIKMTVAILPDGDKISFAAKRDPETIHGNEHDVLQRLKWISDQESKENSIAPQMAKRNLCQNADVTISTWIVL